jgi:hypothetical protein
MRTHAYGSAARVVVGCLLGLGLASCGKTRQTEMSRADTIPSGSTAPPSTASRPGIRFDPAALRPGTPVGELVTESVAARRTPIDSTYVGVARFRGQMRLSGWTLRNPDPDLYEVAICFEADSASATRMPRWSGDERRPWFCFGNRADAARALGPPSEGVPATIVIERLTINRGLSDEVNSAWFVLLVRGGPAESRPAG